MAVTNYYTVNGEIIAEHTAGQSRLDYVTNGIGSVVSTVDQTLTVQSTARYKPFGANMATTGAQPLLGWMGSWGFARTSNTHADIYALPATYSSAEGVWTSEPQMSSQHLDDTYYAFLHRNPVAQNRSLKLPSTLGEGRSSPPICTKLGANCKAVWFTCYSDTDDKSQEHGVAVYCDGSKPADSVKKCCGPKGCRVRCANMKAFCESPTCQGGAAHPLGPTSFPRNKTVCIYGSHGPVSKVVNDCGCGQASANKPVPDNWMDFWAADCSTFKDGWRCVCPGG